MNTIIVKENYELKIKEYVKKFLDYIDVSPKTTETYKIALRQFVSYLDKNNISNPTREQIIEYREQLKEYLKPNTVNSYLIAIRNLYQWLEYEEITKDITKNIKGIKLENRHLKRGLSLEEISKVLSVCKDTREELLVKLMINLGLRCNEVVNIELNDFYDDKGIIMLKVLGKARDGLKQDPIKVDNRLFELIKKYVKEYDIQDYLFVSNSNHNHNGKLTTKTIRYIITNLFKKAELDMNKLSTHSTRHTTCELLLENNIPIQEVSEFMRHRQISTTLIYNKELDQRNSLASNKLADIMF